MIRHWGNLFDDPEGSIVFRIEFGGLMGEFQVFPFKPDLFSNVILTWNCSVPFRGFVDGISGLISVFHQFSDPLFCQIIV